MRFGPNHLSLSDAKLVKTIYNVCVKFLKSNFYAVNDVIQGGHQIQNIFSTRSNKFHRRFVRPIQKIHSLNRILSLEPLADKTTSTYFRRPEGDFVDKKDKAGGLVQWMRYYAWDSRRRSDFQ